MPIRLPILLGALMMALLPACAGSSAANAPTALATLVFPGTPAAHDTAVPASATPAADGFLLQGDRAMINGDYAGAADAYRNAMSAGQQPEKAAFFLARSQLAGGDGAAAKTTLQALLATYPAGEFSARAQFLLGEADSALADWNAAAADYRQFLVLAPGVLSALTNERIGDSLWEAGQFEPAAQAYDAAAQLTQPSDSLALLEKEADSLRAAGQLDQAANLYNRVLSAVTSDAAQARLDRKIGTVLIALGRVPEGYAYCQSALNFTAASDAYLCLVDLLNAGYPVDDLARGIIDFQAGQHEVAIQAFDRYLANGEPAAPAEAHYYRGLAERALDETQNAIADFSAAAAIGSASGFWEESLFEDAYTRWAWLEDYDGAVNDLTGLAGAQPANPRAAEALSTAARIAERDGDLPKAAALWNQSADTYPDSEYAVDARHFAGISLFRSGDYAGAESTFSTLTGSTDAWTISRAWFWVYKCRLARGMNDPAREALQQAAAADPTGYYSERAADLLAGRKAFSSPGAPDFNFDLNAVYQEAERWVEAAFPLATPIPFADRYAGVRNDPRLAIGQLDWDLGLASEAEAEFTELRTSLASDPAGSLYLSRYLLNIGYYPGAIFAARQVLDSAGLTDAQTLAAPAYFNHVRFGPYFADLLAPQAALRNLDSLFLFSLVRQESLFGSSAVSSASAHGLMQLIPSTAEFMAEKIGLSGLGLADLYRPVINLQLGSAYIAQERDEFDGDLLVALAAYNGGPGNAAIWQDLARGDDDLFVEVVRYQETRNYIQSIYELYDIYRGVYSGK